MHIDRIAIDSLASLHGAQVVIDLRSAQPPLAGAGLIAITGPTGAGKSTILDAVCLALFGATPRRDGKNARDLLSRSAVAGSTEVELTLDDGTRWRARWAVRRVRGRLDREVQAPEHTLADAVTGALLASGPRQVGEVITAKLGLTLEQFQAVVLLAQGEFAAFLRCKDKDRASLLEMLTGTGIYARLGTEAYRRWQALDQQCAGQDAALAELLIMSADERHACVTACEQAEADRARYQQLAHERRQDRQAVAQYVAASGQFLQATSERATAQIIFDAAHSERDQLARADAVAPVRPLLQACDTADAVLRDASAAEESAVHDLGAVTTIAREATTMAAQRLATTKAAWSRDEHNAESSRPWRTLDLAMIDAARTAHRDAATAAIEASRSAADVKRLSEQLPALERQCKDAHQARVIAAAEVARCEAVVTDSVAALDSLLAGQTSEQINRIRDHLVEARHLVQALGEVGVSALQEAHVHALDEANRARKSTETLRHEHALASAASAAQRQMLEHLRSLADVAAYRHLLVDGEACPLCGAVDRPAHQHDVRGPLASAEALVATLAEVEQHALRQTQASERSAAQAHAKADAAADGLRRAQTTVGELQRRWQACASGLGLVQDLAAIEATALDQAVTAIEDRRRQLGMAQTKRDQALQTQADAVKKYHVENLAATTADQRREHGCADIEAKQTIANRAGEMAQQAQATADRVLSETAAALHHPLPTEVVAWLADLARRRDAAITTWNQLQEHRRQWDAAMSAWQRVAAPGDVVPSISFVEGVNGDTATWLASAQKAVQTATEQHHAVARVQDRLAVSKQARLRALVQRDGAIAAVNAACHQLGATAETVRAQIMDESPRATLRQRLAGIDQHLHATTMLLHSAMERQAAARIHVQERGGNPDDPQIDAHLMVAEQAAEQQRDAAQTAAITQRQRLLADQDVQARRLLVLAQQSELRAQRALAQRLNAVIGSADGARFRRIAQAMTLDQLLLLANRRLSDLAPRYRLRRLIDAVDSEPTLELGVIDRDQGDAERVVASLSGGETFLVSLALALALADLHRGRLRVGTLFIDEGFGTLDDRTLAQSLTVLEHLQASQGTQILLISHVGSLEERIPHRIEVIRHGGGLSRLRLRGPDGISDTPVPTMTAADREAEIAYELLNKHLRSTGSLTSASAQTLTGRDAAGVKALLERLVSEGVAQVEGQGRGRIYRVGAASVQS